MKCTKDMHDWEIAVVDKVSQMEAIEGVATKARRWLEITAVRRCLACGREQMLKRESASWDADTQNESVEALRCSIQAELESFHMAVKGSEQNDEALRCLRNLIRATYQEIWLAWFGNADRINNAALLVWNSMRAPGYHKDFDAIEITIQDGSPGEPGAFSPETWPSWKGDLVHEMLHELENKTSFQPSLAGIELFRKSTKRFQNHPVDDSHFFTAIVDKAGCFQLTAEQILRYV
jgi:hypothetical protein